jgi:hypothetical protein
MTDIDSVSTAVKQNLYQEGTNSEFLWGAGAIGEIIGRNPRQTHHLLTTGQIQSAKKVGGRWVAPRAALLREFGASFE